MNYHKVQFLTSYGRADQLPPSEKPEIVFAGRSNVGKSSLINRLFQQKGLARVSATPGKTATINFFGTQSLIFADLPGYGYARTSKSMRSEFSKLITDYVLRCEKMHYLFVLIDSRLEPQRIDLRFIEMLGREGIPFGIIFTKADKLSAAKRNRNIALFRSTLAEQWEELPTMLLSSSEKGIGRDEILAHIAQCLEEC